MGTGFCGGEFRLPRGSAVETRRGKIQDEEVSHDAVGTLS